MNSDNLFAVYDEKDGISYCLIAKVKNTDILNRWYIANYNESLFNELFEILIFFKAASSTWCDHFIKLGKYDRPKVWRFDFYIYP